ncbi:uncharacterized protein RSE6_06156 [Rhynchosporium secalis]|uniref:Uncharacterized protein n=1 Tax=Rhynchosporium secalis TaxID=38038 RepID=A0A1E1M9L3_RHYSE|nr:uncharacterized protein RSE6_06156 [Rhynchosporium secalis]
MTAPALVRNKQKTDDVIIRFSEVTKAHCKSLGLSDQEYMDLYGDMEEVAKTSRAARDKRGEVNKRAEALKISLRAGMFFEHWASSLSNSYRSKINALMEEFKPFTRFLVAVNRATVDHAMQIKTGQISKNAKKDPGFGPPCLRILSDAVKAKNASFMASIDILPDKTALAALGLRVSRIGLFIGLTVNDPSPKALDFSDEKEVIYFIDDDRLAAIAEVAKAAAAIAAESAKKAKEAEAKKALLESAKTKETPDPGSGVESLDKGKLEGKAGSTEVAATLPAASIPSIEKDATQATVASSSKRKTPVIAPALALKVRKEFIDLSDDDSDGFDLVPIAEKPATIKLSAQFIGLCEGLSMPVVKWFEGFHAFQWSIDRN